MTRGGRGVCVCPIPFGTRAKGDGSDGTKNGQLPGGTGHRHGHAYGEALGGLHEHGDVAQPRDAEAAGDNELLGRNGRRVLDVVGISGGCNATPFGCGRVRAARGKCGAVRRWGRVCWHGRGGGVLRRRCLGRCTLSGFVHSQAGHEAKALHVIGLRALPRRTAPRGAAPNTASCILRK